MDDAGAQRELDRQYFLELSLVALTAVQCALGEKTPQRADELALLKATYTSEQLAQGAMLVLNALVAQAEDTEGIPVAQQVAGMRALMLEIFAPAD